MSLVLHAGLLGLWPSTAVRLVEAPISAAVELVMAEPEPAPGAASAEPPPTVAKEELATPPAIALPLATPLPAPAAAPLPAPPRPSAARPRATTAEAAPVAPPAPSVSRDPEAEWRSALVEWVQAHKSYPQSARLRGIEGTVTVRFTVARTGAVTDVAITGPSGALALDEAVRRMLEGAMVPPFAEGMAPAARSETVRVGFKLQ
ncbi:MAG: energy transducer TonB [Alphaproteobacteria bacterium]|nr:energy transducer TonB [Alphaproteobacteria bacterium]